MDKIEDDSTVLGQVIIAMLEEIRALGDKMCDRALAKGRRGAARKVEWRASPRGGNRAMIAKRSTLCNALRVAAECYQIDARTHRTGEARMHRTGETWTEEARRRLVEQFERQAREAFALADEIEQADTIELQD
jgi:hypothetical protein